MSPVAAQLLPFSTDVFMWIAGDGLRAVPYAQIDPITHKEFYQFFAFFNNVPERGLDAAPGMLCDFCCLLSEPQQKLNELEAGHQLFLATAWPAAMKQGAPDAPFRVGEPCTPSADAAQLVRCRGLDHRRGERSQPLRVNGSKRVIRNRRFRFNCAGSTPSLETPPAR